MRQVWMIDPSWVSNNIALVADVINGKLVDFGLPEKRSSEERVLIWSKNFGSTLYTPGYFSGFDNAPDDSIAMFDIIGPVVKYGYCNDGSYEMNQLVQEAKYSPRIKGAFFNIDCPGGQVDGIKTFNTSIRNFGKPTLAFVNGNMNSAALVFGTAADEVYASQSLDSIGCAGIYQTIWDQSEYLKKVGIRVIERYAPQSTEKNKTYKDALKGNFSLLDQELFALTEDMLNTIADNRGKRLKGDAAAWNKGQNGFASWALGIGMIDGIMTQEDAVARLDALCEGEESTRSIAMSAPDAPATPTTDDDTNLTPDNYPDMDEVEALLALAGVENPTDEQLDAANGCLTVNNITGATVVRESFIADAAGITQQLTDAQATITTLEAAATAHAARETQLATAQTRIQELEAQVEAFGKVGSTRHGKTPGAGDTPPDAESAAASIDNLPHNKMADAMGYGK